ncbi:MAG: ECF transporter S component [Candidatus Ranarchaeia archaeon]
MVAVLENKTVQMTMTAMFVALSAALRMVKHIYLGGFQFVNLSAVISFLAAVLIGWRSGAIVGFFGYLVSDFFIALPGPWTLVNGILLAFCAVIVSFTIGSPEIKPGPQFVISIYLIMLLFDILSSWFTLYIIVGGSLLTTFFIGVLGLFIPMSGGFYFGVGPITEFVTAFLTALLVRPIDQVIKEVNIF